MATNSGQKARDNINKKILEIKKKIQLSEGQRKALFEECEAERKTNADKILRLKKEISQLEISLHENRSAAAKYRIQEKRLEEVVGPLDKKTCADVKNLLDLQIIDKTKQLNLLRYKIKQKQKRLAQLGEEYQFLLSKQVQKYVKKKIEKPVKKTTCELQNSIHAVEIQWREACHIRDRYNEIINSLKKDAACFESYIENLQQQLKVQQNDIEELQKITQEASKMRGQAKSILMQEERNALASTNARNEQAEEGRRVLEERRRELEKLERLIFQGGKLPARQEPENADEAAAAPESPPETPPNPMEEICEAFKILQQTTGATSPTGVLKCYHQQKDTLKRLLMLRKPCEKEKANLESQHNKLVAELDQYKYAQDKDAEQNMEKVAAMEKQIEQQHNLQREYEIEIGSIESMLNNILERLNSIINCINPTAIPKKDALEAVDYFNIIIDDLILKTKDRVKTEKEKESPTDEDRWLPPLYSGLVKTPVSQSGVSPGPPPTTGSEDEEEVPSREYLKRQAQLVIDAKSRKKNLRLQLPRRK